MPSGNKLNVKLENNTLIIQNSDSEINEKQEFYFSDKLTEKTTVLEVVDNGKKTISYSIEPQNDSEELKGKYINYHVMVFPTKELFIEAILEDTETKEFIHDTKKIEYRVQPVFLNGKSDKNQERYGLGLSGRKLVNDAYTTPTNVRLTMVCDNCKKSFWIKHYHVGFMEEQFFYSTNGKSAVAIGNHDLPGFPTDYHSAPTSDQIDAVEKMLMEYDPDNKYAYYNSFKCKYCGYSIIDFQKHPEIRPNEYYVCYHSESDYVGLKVVNGHLQKEK